MIEKIKFIRNPLTIIAIFAELAEMAGVSALGLLNEELQKIFIWFVMIFPTLLVILFFITLNFNSKALYASSDFRDESNFISLIQKVDQVALDVGKLSRKVSVVLQSNGKKLELPIELRLADLNRAEILGRIGMLPMRDKGRRYSMRYFSTAKFLNQINRIRERNEDSTLVIPCTSDEINQFVIEESF